MITQKLKEEAAYLGSLYACNDSHGDIEGAVSHEAYTLFWNTLSVLFDRMRNSGKGRNVLNNVECCGQTFVDAWAEVEAMLLNGDV